MKSYIEVKLSDLRLSLENPRLDKSDVEQEEIDKMLDDQKIKLFNLAKDIAEHGLNPLDLLAVYPSDFEDYTYVVGEGNRRITALKLWYNPDCMSESAKIRHKFIYDSFIKLNKDQPCIETIRCVAFESKTDKELTHWIELKHLGENQGRGTASWSAAQKNRWNKALNGNDMLLDFFNDLQSLDILNEREIREIKITNWNRILRNVGFKFLNIKKDNDKLILPQDDITTFKEKMRALHKKLRGQTVAIVYDQEKIDKFYEELSYELYDKPLENKQSKFILETDNEMTNDTKSIHNHSTNESSYTSKDTSISSETQSQDTSKKNQSKNDIVKKKNTADLFDRCKTIIPYGLKIRSDNHRIKKIIDELKTLDADEHPNSCGLLLRILFELSSKWYLEKLDGNDHMSEDFQPSINRASRLLLDSKLINKSDKSALDQDVENLRLLFNGYAHNTDSYPSSETMRNKFKAHLKFIMVVLGNDWPIR